MALLLTEISDQVEVLNERDSSGNLYIEGIFAQAEVKNGNRRIYERGILEQAVGQYQEKYVNARRAIGELNHPDRPFPALEEAAILIERLDWHGNNVEGRARVLDTPKGQIVKGLLEADFNMGVSTRGLGSVKESGGIRYVQEGFMLTAVDCVDLPSGPDCYVKPMTESTSEWHKKNGVWVPVNASSDVSIEEQLEAIDEGLFLEKFRDFLRNHRSS